MLNPSTISNFDQGERKIMRGKKYIEKINKYMATVF